MAPSLDGREDWACRGRGSGPKGHINIEILETRISRTAQMLSGMILVFTWSVGAL